jgi:DNA-3-methyladenine glycosylase
MAARGGKGKLFCTGPGRLCRALGLDRSLSGTYLLAGDFFLAQGKSVPEEDILASPRIGVDYAGEDRDRPWRYFVKGSPYVSKAPRRAVTPRDS